MVEKPYLMVGVTERESLLIHCINTMSMLKSMQVPTWISCEDTMFSIVEISGILKIFW